MKTRNTYLEGSGGSVSSTMLGGDSDMATSIDGGGNVALSSTVMQDQTGQDDGTGAGDKVDAT